MRTTSKTRLELDKIADSPSDGHYLGSFPYIYESVRHVPGWLSKADVLVLCALADWQRRVGLDGDILEIGVFQGKSAIILGHFLAPSEHLEVCDVFGSSGDLTTANITENEADYAGLSYQQFESNYLAVHRRAPVVHRMPSGALAPHIADRAFRLVHIDGSHLLKSARADILLATQHVMPGGIIVIDDWSHADHPEVAMAIWGAVLANALIPFATTDMKLYSVLPGPGASVTSASLRKYLDGTPALQTSIHDLDSNLVLQLRLKGWTRQASQCL